ncbi:hypothetical protein [Allorhizobium taibaishanense]|uniref:Uncharacterized protein n=1 Tax=Allorhizobium taibaishanense TaxID=887144 RepID=A0A1Q9A3Q7_9HYPH|nr:hypothetical protein [Allorhizobium taibaishanense]MBB4006244.1 hypothetical protein [Allorhizobium taibaishanense]OLP49223.1 hypothetical protein BJF91_19295 [Allorhizobium taibaishanense]
MNKVFARSIALVFTSILTIGTAHADEAAFLKTLSGNWSGTGTVKLRISAPTVKVNCNFKSNTTAQALALNGRCKSLVVFSRAIDADLKINGGTYSGSYIGAGSGPARLNGKRAGNAINLAITWAKDVNGDRRAQMTIEKIGASGMRLTTVDTDPTTGKSVVTSSITLQRS